jgi:EpsI family protein
VNRNYLLLILVVALLAVTIHLISYDKFKIMEYGVEAVKQVPLRLGGWQGVDQPLDPRVYEILETQAILHRIYTDNNGHEVFLSLVYYSETKVDFHAPEGCLGGRGIKIQKSPATVTIALNSNNTMPMKVNQLIQEQDNSSTLVYYFYKTGDFIGSNYILLRFNLIFNKLKNLKKSGSLIRVSTPLTKNDEGRQSRAELDQFINTLYPYLFKYL